MNRLPSSDPTSKFGLVAWLESTRIALPLKGLECRFQITGATACVEVDQIYHQNTSLPLDCTYTFPLPAGAAVYRCELHVNGRVIRAKVEEKEAARRIHREQKAAGRRTALVETERENLFTLSLGNVQPEDVIVVRFAWFQVLDRAGGGLRLLVPTCPGVRYIPGKPLLRELSGRGTADDTDQVPDASRITPPRIDALHPDAAYFSIEGRLAATDVESGTVSSPSHPIYVRESGEAATVALSGPGTVPDRDFVLTWQEPKAAQLAPQAWRWTEGSETYALVQLRAPEGVKVAEGFPQDFYFLVDRSGSMEGAKWQRTCEALRAFVGLLGADDRISITLFESAYRDFAEAPMLAAAVLADRGFQHMEAIGVGGGTELEPAAVHVLEQIATHSIERRATVVLITDGQVGNEREITLAFKQAPAVTVHCFGIDTAVNDAFLKTLARQQRGGCWLQTPNDDIAGTIAALGDRLRRPVLTGLAVPAPWQAGCATWPDLHAREVVTMTLRGSAAAPLEITGQWPDGSAYTFAMDLGTVGSEAVKLLWAQERIAALIEENRAQEAIALARQYNLICEGAAFIAWDEAEKVQVAQEELVQPAQTPMRVRSLNAMPMSLGVAGWETGSWDKGSPIVCEAKPFRPKFPETAEVSKAFERSGFSKPAIEALLAWAKSDRADTSRRLGLLDIVTKLIERNQSAVEIPAVRVWIESELRGATGGSLKDVARWIEMFRKVIQQIATMCGKLTATKMPREVVDGLMVWVLQDATLRQDRLQRIETFADSLEHLPFAADAQAHHWREFLDSTVGAGSAAHQEKPSAA